MAGDDLDIGEDDRLAKRREKRNGKTRKGAGIFKFLFVILILILAPFIILGPEGVNKLVGLGASDSEEIQRASRLDSGISTTLTAQDVTPDTSVPDVEFLKTEPAERSLNDEEKRRIAELEKRLKDLQDQPKEQAITAEQIGDLLSAQAKTLRDEVKREQEQRDKRFEQQLAALRSSIVPKGPSAEELEAQRKREAVEAEARRKRLENERLSEEERLKKQGLEDEARKRTEDRRLKAEELRKKQLESESLVFDGAEEGETAPGSSDTNGNNDSVRELSSNEQFLQSAASGGFETSKANNLGDLSNTIVQGTIVSAALETAINTELPGNIRAQVTEPVFSYDGNKILMPAGTRLIGTFSADINTAQSRVLIAWNRAITPSGNSVELGSTGTDKLGRSGTLGNVDSRFRQRFGAAILITAISAIPSFLSTESDSSSVDAANDVANDASSDLAEQSESALEERLNLAPIIRVAQGEEIRVFVNRDLVF